MQSGAVACFLLALEMVQLADFVRHVVNLQSEKLMLFTGLASARGGFFLFEGSAFEDRKMLITVAPPESYACKVYLPGGSPNKGTKI